MIKQICGHRFGNHTMRRLVVLPGVLILLVSIFIQASKSADLAHSRSFIGASHGSKPAAQTKQIMDKWAVVIGIDKFQNPDIPPLKYASKDARDFAKFLVEKANFAADHVLLLTNEQATRDNIATAIGDDWLPRRVCADDLVVVFASTHGNPKALDVAGENFLVAYDTDSKRLFATGVKFADLAPTIRQRTGCEQVVLLLDACNSGAASVGKGMVRTRNFDVAGLAEEGQIVISSSRSDQRSYESQRYENGVFTKNLISAFQSHGSNTSLDQAFGKLKEQVENEVRFDRMAAQTPVMKSNWKGGEVILAAVPIRPRHFPGEAGAAITSTSLSEGFERAKQLVDAKKFQEAIGVLTDLAGAGDAKAAKMLGDLYKNGLGVQMNEKQAIEWYKKAADRDYVPAQVELGTICCHAAPPDYSGGMELFQKAALKGDAQAQVNIGWLYKEGWGVPQDYAKAVEWYSKAAAQGNGNGLSNLGHMYEFGLGVPKDEDKAVELYMRAADGGYALTQGYLGQLYETGHLLPKNYLKAIEWYLKAANQGRADAQYRVAHMYEDGLGVQKDHFKAFEWYQKSANQGLADAQQKVGEMYRFGREVSIDYSKAAEWSQKAANQGNACAQRDMGKLYEDGLGVPKNLAKAAEWYQKSADQGNVLCECYMGHMYFEGRGVSLNYSTAAKWFQKAADQGNADACFMLGMMYETGTGVTRSEKKAGEFYRKAASLGSTKGLEAVKKYQ